PEERVSTHIPNPTTRVGQFLRLRQIRLASPKSLFHTFALCNVLGQRHYESRYPLGARYKRNVVAYPNRTAVLAAILFLNLKLSSFSLQQLGDERPVGFAVVLMRYVQKTKCTQFLLRVTHDCLVDMIGGEKAAVQVSQRNADSRILKDGSPPLLAFPKGLLSPLAIFDVDSGSIPSEELSGFIAQRYIANKPPAIFSVCPPNPRFTLHGLPVLNGCVPIGDDPRPVIGMKNRFPLPPECLVQS